MGDPPEPLLNSAGSCRHPAVCRRIAAVLRTNSWEFANFAEGTLRERVAALVAALAPRTTTFLSETIGRTLTARLSANDRRSAVRRVRAALEGEAFTVEDSAGRAELKVLP